MDDILLPGKPQPIFIGLSGGVNYSKVVYKDLTNEYLPSHQFSIDIEQTLNFANSNEGNNFISLSISYDNRNLNIIDTNNNDKLLNLTYITIPTKYERFLFSIGEENQFRTSFVIGPIFSFYISQSPSNVIEKIPRFNFGVILGTKFEYELNPDLSIFIDYNFHFGMVSIQREKKSSYINANIINIGFKVPTKSIF